MKQFVFLAVLICSALSSYSQYFRTRENATILTTDYYRQAAGVPMSQSYVYWRFADSARDWRINFDTLHLTRFGSKNEGTPVTFLWVDANGRLRGSSYASVLGSYLTSETDPVWSSEKSNYYTKIQSDLRYLQTEVDPTVPGAVKAITSTDISNWNTAFANYYPLSNPSGYITSSALSPYLTSSTATSTYYPLTNPSGYITSAAIAGKLNSSDTASMLSPYLRLAQGNSLYYPLSSNPAGYLTGITSSQITSALGYTPYNSTNPSGYITSSSLTWANISGKPTFATVATSGSYSDLSGTPNLSNYYLASNPNGYISGITSGMINSALGYNPYDGTVNPNNFVNSSSLTSTLSNYATTSALTSGLSAKENTITSGTTSQYWRGDKTWQTLNTSVIPEGSNQYFTNTRSRSAISLTTTGSGAATYNSSTGVLNIPTPSVTSPSFNNAPARSLNSSYQISTTRNTRVSYTVSITTAIALLNLNSAGTAFLEISSDNTNWTTINSAGVSRTLSVSITVGLNETTSFNIQGEVPANFFARIRTTTSGGASVSFTSGQEVQY